MFGPVHPVLSDLIRFECRKISSPVERWHCIFDTLYRYPDSYSGFSLKEKAFAAELLSKAKSAWGERWLHGGLPGRNVGDFIESVRRGAIPLNDAPTRPEASNRVVYVALRECVAVGYARAVKGHLYEVEPASTPEVSPVTLRTLKLFEAWYGRAAMEALLPNCLMEFVCPRARVLSISVPPPTSFFVPDRLAPIPERDEHPITFDYSPGLQI